METKLFFGEWLRQQRKDVGLTQNQMALRLNCSLIYLRKLEAGERRPSEQMMEQLAKTFNISQSDQPKFLRFARGGIQASLNEFTENNPRETSVPLVPAFLYQ